MVLCACKEDHTAVEVLIVLPCNNQVLEPPADAKPGMKVLLEGLPAAKEPTKEINLRSKSNKWDAAQPVEVNCDDDVQELRVDANGEAVYKGYHLVIDNKHLKAASLRNVPLSQSMVLLFCYHRTCETNKKKD